ncbi:MAG TPA: PAS domain S-box protein, partial [Flavisolibacter sp.]|nr:PAS domain S-box protein [Flavisolibacter sp.]
KQINEDPAQTHNLERLQQLATEKLDWQDAIMRQRRQSQAAAEAMIRSLTGKRLTDDMVNILQKVEIDAQALLNKRMKESDRLTEVRNTTFFLLAGGAFIALSILLLRIIKEARMRRLAQQKAEISERKYRGLIENSALVVYTMDLECNFSYVSGQCKTLTGFSADELVGESLLTIVDESWRNYVQEFYAAQREKQTFETHCEFPVISKNGNLFWIEQSVVLLYDGGEPVGYQSIAKDVTERKYAEKLLAEAEKRLKAKQDEYQERLQAILDNMPMFVYLKDIDGRFMMVNKQFHQTFGTTDEAVIGKMNVNVHVNESGARKLAEADEDVKRTGKPVEVEDLVLTTEGERNMLIIKFPLYDKNNQLLAISAVGKDITEVIRYQRQLIT